MGSEVAVAAVTISSVSGSADAHHPAHAGTVLLAARTRRCWRLYFVVDDRGKDADRFLLVVLRRSAGIGPRDRYSLTAAEAVDGYNHPAVEAVGRNILTAAEAAARACDRARLAVKVLGDSLVILEARKSRILSVRAGGILISVIKVAVCVSL